MPTKVSSEDPCMTRNTLVLLWVVCDLFLYQTKLFFRFSFLTLVLRKKKFIMCHKEFLEKTFIDVNKSPTLLRRWRDELKYRITRQVRLKKVGIRKVVFFTTINNSISLLVDCWWKVTRFATRRPDRRWLGLSDYGGKGLNLSLVSPVTEVETGTPSPGN